MILTFKNMRNVMSPPICIIISLHVKAITKILDPTSTTSPCSKSLNYDRRIMSFVDVKTKECIEYISDKKEEEGMKDDRGSYGASMHGSTLSNK